MYPNTHSLCLTPLDQEVLTSSQRQDPRAAGPHSGTGAGPGIHHLAALFSYFSVPVWISGGPWLCTTINTWLPAATNTPLLGAEHMYGTHMGGSRGSRWPAGSATGAHQMQEALQHDSEMVCGSLAARSLFLGSNNEKAERSTEAFLGKYYNETKNVNWKMILSKISFPWKNV